MNSVVEMLREKDISKLATPANFRLGKEIFMKGGVVLIENGELEVHAKAGKENRRTVILKSSGNELAWKCTCTSKKNWFCKHCVAVALTLLN